MHALASCNVRPLKQDCTNIVEGHDLRLIRQFQLLEDQRYLPWVWTARMGVELDWLRHIAANVCILRSLYRLFSTLIKMEEDQVSYTK